MQIYRLTLVMAYCISVEAMPYFAFNHVSSPPGPKKSGKIPQNPCTAIRENVPKSWLSVYPTGRFWTTLWWKVV